MKRRTHPVVIVVTVAILVTLAPARAVIAQPFVDETEARFPAANPAEYTYHVAAGDIDGDGDVDLFFANANAFDKPKPADLPQLSRLFVNDGSGKYTDETNSRLSIEASYFRDADFADIDGDEDLDLLCAGAFGQPPRVLINAGNGVFADETDTRFPIYDGFWGSAIAVGDVDMDGDLDLYLTNAGSKMFSPPGGQDKLWLNNGKGIFLDVTLTHLPPLVTRATIRAELADIDNDGDLDVLVTNRDVPSNLLLNDGTGRFTQASFLLTPDGQHSQEIQIGDLNGDDWPDLLVVNGDPTGSTRELLLINGLTGTSDGFVDLTDLFMPGSANPKADDGDIELCDVDSDGDLDVLVGALLPGTERLLLNDGTGKLSLVEGAFDGPPDATLDLALVDVNGDGTADVVTAQGEAGETQNRVYLNQGPADSIPPHVSNVHIVGTLAGYLGPVPVIARITDATTSDSGAALSNATVNGTPMTWAGGALFRGLVGQGLIKGPISLVISATDTAGNNTTTEAISVSPRHPLDVHGDGMADDSDLGLMKDHLLDKGGLSALGDIDGDGDIDLADAQLLASGLGGFPVLTRVKPTDDGRHLLVGANFGDGPSVEVGGAPATVDDSGPFSALVSLPGAPVGGFVLTAGAEASNAVEAKP